MIHKGVIQSTQWTATGGVISNATNFDVEVTWNGSGNIGTVSYETSVSDGTTTTIISETFCITIIPAPTAVIDLAPNQSNVFCLNQEVFFENLSTTNGGSPLSAYAWNFDSSNLYYGSSAEVATSTDFEPSFSYENPGDYTVTLEVWNECGCRDAVEFEITVIEEEAIEITCPTVVCAGQTETYYVNDPECDEYEWDVIGGQIIQTLDNSVTIEWQNYGSTIDGFGYIYFNQANCGKECTEFSVAKVPIITENAEIMGEELICKDSYGLYSLPRWPTTEHLWLLKDSAGTSFPNALTLTDQRNEIQVSSVNLPPGTYDLTTTYTNTMLSCGGAAGTTVIVKESMEADGPDKICIAGGARYEYSVISPTPFSGNVSWTLRDPNQTIVHQVNLPMSTPYNPPTNLTLSGSYQLTPSNSNYCTLNPIIIEVLPKPNSPDPNGSINLIGEVCPNTPYEITFDTEPDQGNVYRWITDEGTVTGGGQGNPVTVQFDDTLLSGATYELELRQVNAEFPDCVSSTPRIFSFDPLDSAGEFNFTPVDTQNGIPIFCTSTTTPFTLVRDPSGADYDIGSGYTYSFVNVGGTNPNSNFGSPVITSATSPYQFNVNWNEISNNNEVADLIATVIVCGQPEEVARQTVRLRGDFDLSFINLPNPVCGGETISLIVEGNEPISGFAGIDVIVGGVEATNITTTVLNPFRIRVNNVAIPNPQQPSIIPVQVTLRNVSGCSGVNASVSADLLVNPSPILSISSSNGLSFCNPLNIVDTTLSGMDSNGSNNTSYTWRYNGSIISTNSQIVLDGATNPNIGLGIYELTATNQYGCNTTRTIELNPCEESDNCTFTGTLNINSASWSSCSTISATGSSSGVNSQQWLLSPNTNTTNTQNTTSSASWTIERAGTYQVTNYGTDATCFGATTRVVDVGYQADLVYQLRCDNAAPNYELIVNNIGGVMPGFNPTATYTATDSNNNTFSPTGTANGNPVFSLPGGTYTVSLSLAQSGFPTCTDSLPSIIVPEKPNAFFDIPDNICTEVPVQLSPMQGFQPGFIYIWTFDGTENINYAVDVILPAQPGDQTVRLDIIDPYGCSSFFEDQIQVNQNTIQGSITGDGTFCFNSNQLNELEFFTTSPIYPTSYQWYLGNEPITGATSQSYDLMGVSGSYYVEYFDSNTCQAAVTPAVNVIFETPPPVTVIGPDTVCTGKEFDLRASINNLDWIYRWRIQGSASVLSSDASYSPTINNTQTVIYELTVTNPAITTANCNTVVTHTVTAENPGDPIINFSNIGCAPYTWNVTVTGGPTNATYTWSNGMSGDDITVFRGGPISVTATGDSGCSKSSNELIPRHPDEYLWIFPTGCHEICGEDVTDYLIGPLPSFSEWEYRRNGITTTTNGGNSAVSDFTLYRGAFSLYLNNDYCDSERGILDVTINCEEEGNGERNAPEERSFWMTPNPASAKIQIGWENTDSYNATQYILYDMTGITLSQKSLQSNQNKEFIDVARLKPGSYIVELRYSDGSKAHQQLIKK
jgi:hypothetical protein